jgi:ketosteroid isomerase-like protein
MRTILILAVASLLLVSCGSPQPDMAALKKTVDEYNAASIDAMKSGNSDKVLSYYTDDAMEMAPNMPMFKGKAAIKDFQNQMAKMAKITDVKFTTVELNAGGKIAYEVGTYEMTMTMGDGQAINDKGKYIVLWKHQEDGSWKVSAETWNSDMPAPSMEKPKETKKQAAKPAATKSTTKESAKKAPAKKTATKK